MVTHSESGARERVAWGPAILALGFAYFAVQAGAALYMAYLPLFAGAFLTSNVHIGLVMTIHHAAIMTVQPYCAGLSDHIDTRLGRRIPFLLIGTPIAAVSFLFLPRAQNLSLLLLAAILINIGGAIFTGPGYALLPDITPPRRRGRANGLLNLMGGLGAVAALLVLSSLFRRSRTLPFDLEAVLLALALVGVVLVVQERRLSQLYRTDSTSPSAPHNLAIGGVLSALRDILTIRDRSVLFLMLAAMAWIAAVTGAQAMFTRYGVAQLALDPAGAAALLGVFAGAFLLFAIPAGVIGDRLGRRTAIRLGGAGMLCVFAAIATTRDLGLIRLFFVAGGVGWGLIIINAYPLLIDRIAPSQTATYTGVWNAALGLAGLLSAPVYGLAADWGGFGAFFVPGVVLVGTALLCTLGIKSAPAEPPQEAATNPQSYI